MNKLYLTIFITLFLSCSRKEPQHELVAAKTIELTREKNKKEYFNFQYLENKVGEDFLVCQSQDETAIFYHSLKKDVKIKSVDIPFNKKISSFFVDKDSTIFFIPTYSFDIFKMNKKGKVDTVFYESIEEIHNLNLKFDLGRFLEFFPNPIAPFIKQGNKLYIPNGLMIDSTYNLIDSRPLFVFDYENPDSLTIDSKIGRFPNTIVPKNKSIHPFDLSISYAINERSELICSYAMDPNLYIYSQNNSVKKIKCQSQYVNKLPKAISLSDVYNQKLIENRFNYSPSYFGIYYDKYRKVYYRTVKHKKKMPASNEMSNIKEFEYSIMILDENFKITGEQVFNHKQHSMYNLIVTKNGILLKTPDDYSGKTKFTLFKLNKNEMD